MSLAWSLRRVCMISSSSDSLSLPELSDSSELAVGMLCVESVLDFLCSGVLG